MSETTNRENGNAVAGRGLGALLGDQAQELEPVPPYTKVLCGDCLCVRGYTDARHEGDDLCECGGEFCGCEDCTDTINAILAGKRKASEIGCKNDVGDWTEADGTRAPNAKLRRAP